MSSDPQALIDRGLSLWSADRRAAEKAFVEVYWKHEDTREAELAQAYLFKLRNGDPRPEATKMEPDIDGLERGSRKWFRAQYQAMANLYLFVFTLAALMLLSNARSVFGGVPDFFSVTVLINASILALPAILLAPRVYRRYRHGSALISDEFARARTAGLAVGKLFVWIATIGFVLSLAVIVLVIVTQQTGVPAGLGIGISMWPLMIGTLTIEISYRRWARKSGLQ